MTEVPMHTHVSVQFLSTAEDQVKNAEADTAKLAEAQVNATAGLANAVLALAAAIHEQESPERPLRASRDW